GTLITTAKDACNLDNDRTLNYIGKEGDLREALDNIRNHISLSNARMTSYTYDTLVGITSETDAKGYTIYYDYDIFNRLKQVKDIDGNILEKTEYNYKNEY